MLRFEQALIRLQWGTYANYNTAVEVVPCNIRKVWIAWNLQNFELRQYLSGQAAARDLGIDIFTAKKAAILPISLDSWVVCSIRDGTTSVDLQRCFDSMEIVEARLPYGLGLTDNKGFERRDPPWGELIGSMCISINNHQMYPPHNAWEYKLAANRAKKGARSAVGDADKNKAQKLAIHYAQCARDAAAS